MRILMRGASADGAGARAALAAGVTAYLLRDGGVPALLAAIRQVAHGNQAAPALDSVGDTLKAALTPREMIVLVHVAAGHSNKEIARTLRCGTSTVEKHIGRIYQKLSAGSRAEAPRIARHRRLLPEE